jgi:hypothetical protein
MQILYVSTAGNLGSTPVYNLLIVEPFPVKWALTLKGKNDTSGDDMNKTKTRTIQRIAALLSSAFILAACGGGGGGGGNSPPPPPPPTATFGANFSEIQAAVFTPTCAVSGCHTGAAAPEGLRLDETNSYTLLVGVASNQDNSVLRVAAADPNNSYLIQKLEGTAAGSRMPLNGTPLIQANIDMIRQWITDGAIDDRAQASDPIRVSSLAPMPDAILNAAPTQILAGFDRDPDATTVNLNTFLFEGSGGDGTFGDGNETSITAASITVPGANLSSAVFDLTGVAMPSDSYRVQLLGSGASVIMDMDANALDGEFSGAFPSGDNTAGGNFEATFELQVPPPVGITLDEIQAAVFTPNCATASCHTGPAGNNLPAGMDLSSADASFASLVNVVSQEDPNFIRIDPLNPNGSYLIHKLEGTASTGVRMPLGGTPLDQATIDNTINDTTQSSHELLSYAYYVGNSGRSCAGAPVPSLMRVRLDPATGLPDPVELLPGVEHFQVQYGVNDGVNGEYQDADDVTDFNQVTSVRIWLLIRAECAETGYTDETTYSLGNQEDYLSADTGFRRQLYSSVVMLRNG